LDHERTQEVYLALILKLIRQLALLRSTAHLELSLLTV